MLLFIVRELADVVEEGEKGIHSVEAKSEVATSRRDCRRRCGGSCPG